MPTAEDFDMWCRSLSERAEQATGVVGPLVAAATPDVLVGGRLAVTVDVAVRSSQANALAIAGMLLELADECGRRAQICRTYEAALGTYATAVQRWEVAQRSYLSDVRARETVGGGVDVVRAVGLPPAPPCRPDRPASWVEVAGG